MGLARRTKAKTGFGKYCKSSSRACSCARIDVIDTGVADDPSLNMGPDGTLHVSYRKTSGLWYAKNKH